MGVGVWGSWVMVEILQVTSPTLGWLHRSGVSRKALDFTWTSICGNILLLTPGPFPRPIPETPRQNMNRNRIPEQYVVYTRRNQICNHRLGSLQRGGSPSSMEPLICKTFFRSGGYEHVSPMAKFDNRFTDGKHYRGTSLVRNCFLLGSYSRPCLGPYGGPRGVEVFNERGAPVTMLVLKRRLLE